MADDIATPAPTPGGDEYVEKGGKECKDENYFIAVCETGFVDPTLRRTIVEASATLNDCEVCVTAAEVREAVDAIKELQEQMEELQEQSEDQAKMTGKSFDSSYSCGGGSSQSSSSSEYQDVTIWSEDAVNGDFTLTGGTVITVNASGTCRCSCSLKAQSLSDDSSLSARIMYDSGEGYVELQEKTISTTSTEGTISLSRIIEVADGDAFKIQYRNNSNESHQINDSSTWNMDLATS